MSREKPVKMSSELSTGKTIVILAVVVGCFAVLWPKVLYPMLTSSVKPSQGAIHPHVRPERPAHLNPDSMHPALREKGRSIPHRTIEKQARPGPMPGIRPPMGGGGHITTQQTKGSGAMGILMPIYTVGIIVFFIYTIMKVLFKKDCEEGKSPKLKDFNLDPEYRKYVFDEEYLDNTSASHLRRHERDNSKYKMRNEPSYTDPKIEDEQMDELRRRLEETESAMERLMSQMGSVTDKLTAAKITEVLTQVQTQARVLKDENIDYYAASEMGAVTISEDFSLPLALQRRLEELNVKDIYMKGTFVGLDDLDSLSGENNILASKELLELKNYLNKVKLLSENLDDNEQIDLEIMESKKIIGDIVNSNEEIIVQQNIKGRPDQYSIEGLSDIAQIDSPGGLSDDDNISGTSETGADISELNTYADDGVITPEAHHYPTVIGEVIPEANYVTPNDEHLSPETKEQNPPQNRSTSPSAIEQGTQTHTATKVSVMDLQTTYMLKQQALRASNLKIDDTECIKEIILDATLPMDTQLLIKDSHFCRLPSENLLESEPSEDGLSPCVVTSQVNLAFVGLEQAEFLDNTKFIVPEIRKSPLPPRILACMSQKMPEEDLCRLQNNAFEKCQSNASAESNIHVENSCIEQNHLNTLDETPLSLNNLGKCIIEAIVMQIVKEATEESFKIISKVVSSEKLRPNYIVCSDVMGGIKKSDAEKLSSSRASTIDLGELSPKVEENSIFVRNQEEEHVKNIGNKSS